MTNTILSKLSEGIYIIMGEVELPSRRECEKDFHGDVLVKKGDLLQLIGLAAFTNEVFAKMMEEKYLD